jgi:hypothetical protein
VTRELTWGAGLRWAFGARAWFGLFASMSDGRLLLRHELTWIRVTEKQAATEIIAAVSSWNIPNLRGGIIANHDLWPESGKAQGESRAETFGRFGVALSRGSKDRVNNFARLRAWLADSEWKDADGVSFTSPGLLIHPDCRYFLKTLPVLVSDSLNVDDISECAEEYPAVGASLYLMSRPLPSVEVPKPEPGPGTWGHALAHVFAGRGPRGTGLLGGFRYR